MEDRILRLHPVIKELVADMEKQKKDVDNIINGMHGLKEINATLRKLVRKVEDSSD